MRVKYTEHKRLLQKSLQKMLTTQVHHMQTKLVNDYKQDFM